MKLLRIVLAVAVMAAFVGCTDAGPAPKPSAPAPAKTDSC